jgi:thiol:disulfide interchange protein DsbD
MRILLAWLLCALAFQAAHGRALRVQSVSVELLAERAAVTPGEPLRIGLAIRHDPHWHTYWRNPGDSGLPTTLELTLPEGVRAGPIEWPVPDRIPVGPLVNFGYEGDLLLPLTLSVPASLAGDLLRIAGRAQWLMCKDVCIPGEADLVLELPVARGASAARSAAAAAFEAAQARLPGPAIMSEGALGTRSVRLAFDPPGGGTPSRVAWFPYAEGLIDNPAPQALARVEHQGRVRYVLEARLAEGVDAAAVRKAGLFEGPSGVLVVDGRGVELRVESVAALPEGRAIAAEPAPAAAGRGAGLHAGDAGSLVAAILLGLGGGLILNLMPCVFPVIGLKVLGFASHDRDDPAAARGHALAFAAGVVAAFWVLAGVLFALRAGGEAVGWGFQLQSPIFVTAMALLFVAIGLNLSGVYEVGVSLTRLGESGGGSQRPMASIGSGVLAVLVATPCTAPLMGGALGYTLGRPLAEGFAVFTAIGVGMAVPYLLLGLNPSWMRWLPRPGRWMQTLREVLSFPMYATAAWLSWVLAQQSGVDAVLMLGLGAVLIALAAWVVGRFAQGRASASWGAWCLAAAIAIGGVWTAWPPVAASTEGAARVAGDAWEPWSEARVVEAHGKGQPVLVDFTAAWCVTCQANKKLVLQREPVVAALAARGVLRLRADWTRRDPAITAALARFGRNGVPLYLLYLPGRPDPVVLPELLTPGIVIDALGGANAAASSGSAPGPTASRSRVSPQL